MIYDCFLFNNEIELLKLRLAFMNDMVDYFVLVESERTLSGQKKVLHFKENESEFKEYAHKIIYLQAPLCPELSAWDYEYFQRNYIKEGLKNCYNDDLILISDVDEIINLKSILALKNLQLPALIELPYYYYFLNLKSSGSFKLNLLSPYSFIKNLDIGIRNPRYKKLVSNVVRKKDCKTGWHFSYLFGYDFPKYEEKLKAFSHQEYNTPYYLDYARIKKCINLGIDLFERKNIFFSFKNPEADLAEIFPVIKSLGLQDYICLKKRSLLLSPESLIFVLRARTLPLLVSRLFKQPKNKIIVATSPFRKRAKRLILPIANS